MSKIAFKSEVGMITLSLNKISDLNIKIERNHTILEFNYVSKKKSDIKQFPGSFEIELDEIPKIIQQIEEDRKNNGDSD
jgi:hypothetical protein